MMKTRISVIMGVYNFNRPELLKRAVNSVLEQTFQNFEFIICDDGSTDGTWELLQQLYGNDSRIILIRNDKNHGLAFSLNHCLRFTSGEYIARMDADDISYSSRFEKQIRFLDAHPEYALVTTWADLFEDDGHVWGIRKVPTAPQKMDLLFGPPFIHAAMLMRASVLKDLGGYRICKETLRAEDYDLWMRMYSKGYQGYNLQETLYKICEGKEAYKRRSYKYRLDEARVRYHGFKALGLLTKGFPYIMKPLIVGLIPQKLLRYVRKEKSK